MISGTYSVDGNVFTETSNTGGCITNVSFNYTFDGSALTFTYVGNPKDDVACDGRKTAFNNVTYILTTLSLPFPAGKFRRADRVDPVGFIFNADGTWQAWDKYMNIITKGTYSVDGETYTELSNEIGCSTPISFKYTYDGETLTFNYIGDPAQDACDGRRSSFDIVPCAEQSYRVVFIWSGRGAACCPGLFVSRTQVAPYVVMQALKCTIANRTAWV